MTQSAGSGRWVRTAPGTIVINLAPSMRAGFQLRAVQGDEEEQFLARFQIRQRLPMSRLFPVSSGSVTVRSTAGWDRPAQCAQRASTYSITLWRQVDWWWDENHGTKTFPTRGTATATWSGLPSGTYYVELYVGNSDTNCILVGELDIT